MNPVKNQARLVWVFGNQRYPIKVFEAHEGMNQPMTARINMQAPLYEKPTELMGQACRIEVRTDDSLRYFDGIITAATLAESSDRENQWTLTIGSKLMAGRLQQRTRLFMQPSRRSVVAALLAEMGYQSDEIEWRVDNNNHTPNAPRLQANESNYDCFARLLSEAGWNYWFEPNDDEGANEHLVISTQQHYLMAECLPLIARSPLDGDILGQRNQLISLQVSSALNSAPAARIRVTANDAFAPLTLKQTDPERERCYPFGHWETFIAPPNESSAQQFVRQDAARRRLNALRVSFASHQLQVRPAYQITLDCRRAPGLTASGNYLVLAVHHYGEQPRDELQPGVARYHNTAVASPAANCQLFPPVIEPPRDLPMLFPAHIESRSPLYAEVDSDGRYYLRTRFDAARPNTPAGATEASPAIEVRVPYASPLGEHNHPVGWHFPLVNKSTVLVSCLNGDPNRPLIMGFSPNRRALNPVLNQNAQQYRLITPAQNELRIDDDPANPCIILQTFDGQVRLVLNSQQAEPFLELATRHGAINIHLAKDLIIKAIDGSLTEQVGHNRLTRVKQNSLSEVSSTTHYQSAANQRLYAKQNLHQRAEGEVTLYVNGEQQLRSGGALHIEADQGWLLQAPNGALLMRSPGCITITAKTELLLTSGNGNAGIKITPSSVKLFGKHITLKGSKTVQFNGNMNHEKASAATEKLAHSKVPQLSAIAALTELPKATAEPTPYRRKLQLVNEQGDPLANHEYLAIYRGRTEPVPGISDNDGYTHVYEHESKAEFVQLLIKQEHPADNNKEPSNA